MIKKVTSICLGILIFISFCEAIPLPEDIVNKMQTIYPYGLEALILCIISFSFTNFLFLWLLANKDKRQKGKIFAIFFSIILFCVGKLLGGITKEVPMSVMLNIADTNMIGILNYFIMILVLIDIIYLIITIVEKIKNNKNDGK